MKHTTLIKTLLKCAVLSFAIFACSGDKTKEENKQPSTALNSSSDALGEPQTIKSFRKVEDFPIIKDSVKFIDDLRRVFNLEVDNSPVQRKKQKITVFETAKIYGSDKNYYFIEYDWKAGAMASYPWRSQLLLKEDGKLVKVFSGLRFDFLKIYQNQNPFLLILTSTGKGNGGHEIYRFTADTLENVLDGDIQTYDAHEDVSVFHPSELKIEVKDVNQDHFNDLLFVGEKLMLGKYSEDSVWFDVENGKAFTVEHPAMRIPVKYEFLFDRQSGHFIENKDPSTSRSQQMIIQDTIRRIIVDDYPVKNKMLEDKSRSNSGRMIKSGETYSYDQVWFGNDSLKQTLVFELYTDYHRLLTYHFFNNEIPTDLINSMALGTADGNSLTEKQKLTDINGFFRQAKKINSSYFTSRKGFNLGDEKQKAVDIYGKPDKQSFHKGIEKLEWEFIGDVFYDGKSDLKGKPLAKGSFGHQVVMYFKDGLLVGQILHNDIP